MVLDQDLRVIAASRSFYRTFKVDPGEIADGNLKGRRDSSVASRMSAVGLQRPSRVNDARRGLVI